MSKQITEEQLKNKIGMQIGFLLHSGKDEAVTIQHLTEIAIEYASHDGKSKEWQEGYNACLFDEKREAEIINSILTPVSENREKMTVTDEEALEYSMDEYPNMYPDNNCIEVEIISKQRGAYIKGIKKCLSLSLINQVTVSDEKIKDILSNFDLAIRMVDSTDECHYKYAIKDIRSLFSSPDDKIKQKWTREYTKHVIDTINECPVIECNYPNCNCEKQKAIKYTYSDELARCVDCDKVNTTVRRNDVPVCAGCCNKRTLKQREEKKSLPTNKVTDEEIRKVINNIHDIAFEKINYEDSVKKMINEVRSLLSPSPDKLKQDVTRFEVIDETGRVYTNRNVNVELSYQDEGRTFKVFLKQREEKK